MKYVASYSWHPEKACLQGDSLLLQQLHCGKVPMILACVSTGDYLTGRLLDWFYREGRRLCGKEKWKKVQKMQESLCRVLHQTCRESKAMPDFAGIVCVGSHYMLFYRGRQRICLINTKFLRSNVKRLTGPDLNRQKSESDFCTEQGTMQTGIGILLALESFYEKITDEMLKECLERASIRSRGQLTKHLGELDGNAVMILTEGGIYNE